MAMIAVSLLLLAAPASAHDGGANPVQKVLSLLSDLEVKINEEGAAAEKAHIEFTAWCKERSAVLNNEVQTGESEVEDLKAAIDHASAAIEEHSTRIEESTANIASGEAELKAATEVRGKERSEFEIEEKDLVETISALERAVGILEKEAGRGGAALAQCEKAGSVVQAISTMVESSMLGSRDAKTLTALVQNSAQDSGSPDGTVYGNHGGSIINTLRDLLEKATSQLDDARHRETAATQNFKKLKQSLEDSITYANQDLATAKSNRAAQEQAKATATDDHGVTAKNLAENQKALRLVEHDCASRTQEYEEEQKSRGEELKALAEAKKVISEMTGAAQSIHYGGSASSFLQLEQSAVKTGVDLANFEVVQFVRKLAREQHSEALAQLGRRVASSIREGTLTGENPFGKVKRLISELIARLQSEADADADEKAYCDKEVAYNTDKEERRKAEVEQLATSIDTMEARSVKLKEQIAALQKALADLAATQKEMNALRKSQHEQYVSDKADMEKGIEGVKLALKLLREYYAKDAAHETATGRSSSIIGILEVAEADFTKTLAEIESAESAAQAEYEEDTKENEVERTTKEQDVAYKNKEVNQLSKALREASADHKSASGELSAILEYKAELTERCRPVHNPKAEQYAERKAKRDAEIAGLEEALSILESEAALLQHRNSVKRHQG